MERSERLVAGLTAAATLGAALGCVLPWEWLEVTPLGPTGSTAIDAFHGLGVAACLGACLGLLGLAHLAWNRRPSEARLTLTALAATLLMIGSALFTLRGGYAPRAGDQYSVRLGPGLLLSGAAGAVLLLATAAAAHQGRRSPRP